MINVVTGNNFNRIKHTISIKSGGSEYLFKINITCIFCRSSTILSIENQASFCCTMITYDTRDSKEKSQFAAFVIVFRFLCCILHR